MNLDLFKDCDAEALKEIEELQNENERLKSENLKHREDKMTMALKYNEVLNELNDENERLKRELKQTEAQDQVVIDGLRKENAKLKCLALHGMFGYACAKMNVLVEKPDYKYGSGKIHKDFSRWHRLCRLWLKAYRKAKAELRHSNG